MAIIYVLHIPGRQFKSGNVFNVCSSLARTDCTRRNNVRIIPSSTLGLMKEPAHYSLKELCSSRGPITCTMFPEKVVWAAKLKASLRSQFEYRLDQILLKILSVLPGQLRSVWWPKARGHSVSEQKPELLSHLQRLVGRTFLYFLLYIYLLYRKSNLMIKADVIWWSRMSRCLSIRLREMVVTQLMCHSLISHTRSFAVFTPEVSHNWFVFYLPQMLFSSIVDWAVIHEDCESILKTHFGSFAVTLKR